MQWRSAYTCLPLSIFTRFIRPEPYCSFPKNIVIQIPMSSFSDTPKRCCGYFFCYSRIRMMKHVRCVTFREIANKGLNFFRETQKILPRLIKIKQYSFWEVIFQVICLLHEFKRQISKIEYPVVSVTFIISRKKDTNLSPITGIQRADAFYSRNIKLLPKLRVL